MPGSTAQTNKYHTFYLQQRQDNGDTWADIKVNHPLDYETIKEYNLTIRVEVSFFLSFFDAYKSTMMQFTHRTRETRWKYPSESFADGLRLIVLTFHRINTLKLARLLRSSAQLAFKLNLREIIMRPRAIITLFGSEEKGSFGDFARFPSLLRTLRPLSRWRALSYFLTISLHFILNSII